MYRRKYAVDPMIATPTIAVMSAAPTLSFVWMLKGAILVLELPKPAAGLPNEDPRVSAVKGGEKSRTRKFWTTSNAHTCSPKPYIRSHVLLVHEGPHV